MRVRYVTKNQATGRLKAAKFPISMDTISERLEYSIAIVYRTISDLRDGAPIETHKDNGGYFYADKNAFELPGLRLQPDEVAVI